QIELPQGVDRPGLAFMLDVPERPSIAAGRALQRLADAVNRADFLPADERAIGAHAGRPAALPVEQLRARLQQARLHQRAAGHARGVLAALHRLERAFVEWQRHLDPLHRRAAIAGLALAADPLAAQ